MIPKLNRVNQIRFFCSISIHFFMHGIPAARSFVPVQRKHINSNARPLRSPQDAVFYDFLSRGRKPKKSRRWFFNRKKSFSWKNSQNVIYDFLLSLLFPHRPAIFGKTWVGMYDTTEAESGHCLECGGPVYGRTDKKFCCDSCRNRYHGHLRYQPVKAHNATLKILTHNYSVLEALFRLKGASCPVSTLLQMGFLRLEHR